MTLKLGDNPLKRAEGFTMDCYCRYEGGYAHDRKWFGVTFYGKSKDDVHAQARAAGWVLHRDGTSSCPECVVARGLR